MKIVALDGYTLNPGDLSWDGFESLGDFISYDRTPKGEIANRAKEADVILINKVEITKEILAELHNLKYIGVLATGYNVVDVKSANERNIVVTNIPSYGTNSVAQMVFALLLELTQNVGLHSDSVKNGEWSKSEDWCYWKKPLVELNGLTLGIIGLGRIGTAVANLGKAFGMKILANDTSKSDNTLAWIKMVDQDEIFNVSDIISLHCPLTDENKEFVNADKLRMMKKSAFLINTSRGQLINENDLAAALNYDRIAGAALDVLSKEPPDENNPLLSAKNCIITPHIAWATKSARQRLMDIAVDNLKSFIEGNPKNVVRV